MIGLLFALNRSARVRALEQRIRVLEGKPPHPPYKPPSAGEYLAAFLIVGGAVAILLILGSLS